MSPAGGDDVMAAVDRSLFVIADVTVDDAWLAMPVAQVRPLAAWR